MGKIWKRFLDALYPEGITCNLCDEELTNKDDRKLGLCAACYRRLEKSRIEKQTINGCDVFSAYAYDSVRVLILGCKDNDRPYLAKTIARLLYDYYKDKNFSFDVVTYVPCGRKNIKRRGYDHMKYVAGEFCELTGLPFSGDLKRVKETSDQTQVEIEKRYENVQGGFLCEAGSMKGKRVLLLDDVITTGATLSACIQALKSGGSKKIVCLTLGKAGE